MDHETTPPKQPGRFSHSEHLTERKRALFPSQGGDSDSDLGHMSPLENSSSPERYETLLNVSKTDNINFRYFTFFDKFKKDRTNVENDENVDPAQSHPKNDILAQNAHTPNVSPDKNQQTKVSESPVKSPTAILKTPHDNSSTNLKLPRLIRKSLTDISNIDKSNLKRKSDSPVDDFANKSFKLDHSSQKPPKARTALFTKENEIFSVKSFYGKSESSKPDVRFRVESSIKTKNVARKPPSVYLCNRGNKNKRKFFGQINAGVRHGIRKPKRVPALTKTQLLKAALSIVKNSPLNEFLDDTNSTNSENECGVSLEQIKKMDSILKNLDTPTKVVPLAVFNEPDMPSEQPPIIKTDTTFGMKRPLSPQMESTRKFFKSGPSKATVNITDNITLKLDHGELSLMENEIKFKKPRKKEIIDFDMSDISFGDENLIDSSFTDILKSLEDDKILEPVPKNAQVNNKEEHSPDKLIEQNPIKDIQIDKDLILSPTSLMCDLTSGLVLESPKSQTLATEIDLKKASFKKRISFPDAMSQENKLFPIFCGKQNVSKPEKKEGRHVKNIRKIWKPLAEDQTLIDAGQKKFGVTQCPDCKVMYSMGEPEDEIMHFNYHNNINVFKYHMWKNERIVNQFKDGKVIQVNPNDPKTWLKKVKDVIYVVNQELGFADDTFVFENKKVFLCIINKQIVGCLVAELKKTAHRIIQSSEGPDFCSEESYPVKCGISRIWVAQHQRNKGIATCMLNSVRSRFLYGHILSINDVAFSSPTEDGKKFAEKYTGTNRFLIYIS